jgi:UDP-GlcNAc3NAcA epimerase
VCFHECSYLLQKEGKRLLKVLTVVGARPQFIKAAMVSRELRKHENVSEILVHTGQHYDENMSDVFFEQLDIPIPDYSLGVGSDTQGAQTGRMLQAIEDVLIDENPYCVIVYGDTNSTLAGALAAVKLHIPVAHVEAGLRSFNRKMPEEINRIVTDHVSDVLFAPTETAVENLIREGFERNRVHLVGDVMYDAALFYAKRAEAKSTILRSLNLTSKAYILATVHRAENTDNINRLKCIFGALTRISEEMPVVLPLHPRTKTALQAAELLETVAQSIQLVEPMGYLDMVLLEKNAALIATDSGGVQKEAFFHRVPCVTLRDETEWVELVNLGWNRVVAPTTAYAIVESIRSALTDYNRSDASPYGDGRASTRIVQYILKHFR